MLGDGFELGDDGRFRIAIDSRQSLALVDGKLFLRTDGSTVSQSQGSPYRLESRSAPVATSSASTSTAAVVPIMGPPGADGADGEQGPPGLAGVAGARGADGIGIDGQEGSEGQQGVPGAAGAAGAAGVAGAAGPPGADGAPGEDGERGPPGPTGASGVGGGGSATTVETNISTAKFTGKFTITDATISGTSKVLCWQAPGPYTGKGARADEAEMQPVSVIAVEPSAGSAIVKWQTPPMVVEVGGMASGRANTSTANPHLGASTTAYRRGKVRGNVKFSYMVLA